MYVEPIFHFPTDFVFFVFIHTEMKIRCDEFFMKKNRNIFSYNTQFVITITT